MTVPELSARLLELLDRAYIDVTDAEDAVVLADRRSEVRWIARWSDDAYRLIEVQRRDHIELFRAADAALLERAVVFFLQPSAVDRQGLLIRLPREEEDVAAGYTVVTIDDEWETLAHAGGPLPCAMRSSPPASRAAGFSYLVEPDLDDIVASYLSPTAEPLFKRFLWRTGAASIEAGCVFAP